MNEEEGELRNASPAALSAGLLPEPGAANAAPVTQTGFLTPRSNMLHGERNHSEFRSPT